LAFILFGEAAIVKLKIRNLATQLAISLVFQRAILL